MSPSNDTRLTDALRLMGVATSSQICARINISQPTLSRLVRAAGPEVLRIGRGRATCYALARDVRTFGNAWPVYRIDSQGRPEHAAMLHALHAGPWWYEPAERVPSWLHGEYANGVFPDLPWFLDDVRPQGFMGRAFARRYADELRFGPDPTIWSSDDVLTALLLHGEDLPGDFVIGDSALDRVQQAMSSPPAAISADERATAYGPLALAAMAGDVPGSSAGGEQPKFAAAVHDGDTIRHVLVKFSPPLDTPTGRRWADLLVCEQLAAETLSRHGFSTCRTACVAGDERYFLEAERFDRVGPHGRRGVVTLAGLDNGYYGRHDDWSAAADRMERDGWITSEDAERLRTLWWFGRLIGNTDMHFGNVSFMLDHQRPLRLAPAYDMLPMHYRPAASGEIPDQAFSAPLPTPRQLSQWRAAVTAALDFLANATEDRRVSPAFRDELARLVEATRVLYRRFA